MQTELLPAVVALLNAARDRNVTIAVAESCTAGLLGAAITAPAGATAVFLGGFITYANSAKIALLGVAPDLIANHGAVSAEVAAAMAEGARLRLDATLALSITGVAGPDGGSARKPVGLVWFGLADRGAPTATEHRIFSGLNRAGVRAAAVEAAIGLLAARLDSLSR